MYLDHYGFNILPFELPPNLDFLYLGQEHKKALVHLRYALLNQDSFTLITGEVGAGKTILLQRLLRSIPKEKKVITVYQTQISPFDLIYTIAAQLGLIVDEKVSKGALLTKLTNYLNCPTNDRSIVIVVDEAQRMPLDTLEELRMLGGVSNHMPNTDINIILCGQPELRKIIQKPQLEQLHQRIKIKFHLTTLDLKETRNYIKYRLKCAGQFSVLFSDESMSAIFAFTHGLPRRINLLADTALACGFTDGSKTVGLQQIKDAVSELGWVKPKVSGRAKVSSIRSKISHFNAIPMLEIDSKEQILKHLVKIDNNLETIANGIQYLAAEKFRKAH